MSCDVRAARFRSRAPGAKPLKSAADSGWRQRIAPRVAIRYVVRSAPLRPIAGVHRRTPSFRASETADATRKRARSTGPQTSRTTVEGKALGQQRRDFVGMHRNEGACGNGVVTTDGAARQDREDGQKAAKRKPAVAAVGDGVVSAKTPRELTTIPPHQRASDSHDYTRLAR
jgi:hypothetical protein